MSTIEAIKGTQEYRSIPIAQLKESSTNPRKAFDEARLAELAESIRSKGVLSPLLVRRVNGHYEIVAGAQRFRAAQRAGLREVRLAKRHGLQSPKDQHAWQVVEKARGLYKVTATAELARLILEAILIGSAANIRADKENDLLIDAAALYSVDMKVVRAAVENEEKRKTEKKAKSQTKSTARKPKAAAER